MHDRITDMTRLQAVFWDVDGTLADTELNGHRQAFNQAFADCGLSWNWNEQLYSELLSIPGGRQRMQSYAQRLGDTLDAELLERLRRSKQQHYLKVVSSGAITLRPGVSRLLHELNRADVQQWIVTSSGEASVLALLESFSGELTGMFEGTVTADDVDRHKPHPDPYQLALDLSGSDRASVVVFEDSTPGLQSARAAGLCCVLTPSPWDRELENSQQHASAVIDQLGEDEQKARIFSGPPCAEGLITLEYLELLLSATSR
ncbi:HAD hydrolase/ IA/ variant 3 family protein [Synechococcus sp. BIOS-E4-1]|uniref:HAD-IA family hydrolase n=1 Tax=Synechococcus sp. BIOS-E4-1 TaxID=1400864 RepID=UPI001861674A|nr:HAD hydrolase/ IA/ variant 3 family protein [Synechococcus sp. BIOS-E4-1]